MLLNSKLAVQTIFICLLIEEVIGELAFVVAELGKDPGKLLNAVLILCQSHSFSREDLLAFAGPASSNYQTYFLQFMGASAQSAAYGVGVAAQFGGPTYVQFCLGLKSYALTNSRTAAFI